MNSQWLIAVLAGGKSERMGRDKALLMWRGLTLLERIAREANRVSSQICVVGREKPEGWQYPSLRFLPDTVSDSGPLGGLISALQYAEQNSLHGVLATACDMPLLDTDAFLWLLTSASQCHTHGAIVLNHQQYEPLFSLYSVEALPLVQSQLNLGKRSLHGLIEKGDFSFIEAPTNFSQKLLNLNLPDDLAALQAKTGHQFS
jgi:molybdopterin-guanine dinucleotide biosynthesis protein A